MHVLVTEGELCLRTNNVVPTIYIIILYYYCIFFIYSLSQNKPPAGRGAIAIRVGFIVYGLSDTLWAIGNWQ